MLGFFMSDGVGEGSSLMASWVARALWRDDSRIQSGCLFRRSCTSSHVGSGTAQFTSHVSDTTAMRSMVSVPLE